MDRRAERLARAERLKEARLAAGFPSARMAAMSCGWNYDTYYSHEAGRAGFDADHGRAYARRFRVDLNWLMLGENPEGDSKLVIPVMGRVGAGGDVEPDFEQVPPEGLEQIELPGSAAIAQSMVDEPIGFQVVGDSMYPRYSAGDILVVDNNREWALDSLIGQAAVVRIHDDNDGWKRLVKIVRPGSRGNRYNLESIDRDTPTVEDVQIAWARPVRMIIPEIGLRKLSARVKR